MVTPQRCLARLPPRARSKPGRSWFLDFRLGLSFFNLFLQVGLQSRLAL